MKCGIGMNLKWCQKNVFCARKMSPGTFFWHFFGIFWTLARASPRQLPDIFWTFFWGAAQKPQNTFFWHFSGFPDSLDYKAKKHCNTRGPKSGPGMACAFPNDMPKKWSESAQRLSKNGLSKIWVAFRIRKPMQGNFRPFKTASSSLSFCCPRACRLTRAIVNDSATECLVYYSTARIFAGPTYTLINILLFFSI